MAPVAFLAKSRLLVRAGGAKCISTFVSLNQEAQLAEASIVQPPPPPPLPPNPASGSPMYQENWRSPIPDTPAAAGALIPVGSGFQWGTHAASLQFLSGPLDAESLMNKFAEWTTAQKWDEIRQYFEYWLKTVDVNGKLNIPDVNLYNHYLRASLMQGASAGELLDYVAQMEVGYKISPNTASYNLVLKAMHEAGEIVAAQKLLERMILSGKVQKESAPDDESYDLLISMLLSKNQLDSAVKYIDLSLKSGFQLTFKSFLKCVQNCLSNSKLDTLASVIERCKKTDQNKSLYPNWGVCNNIADAAMQSDNSILTYQALEFIAKWIARGEIAKPPVLLSVNEGLILSALGTAGRTFNSRILDASWTILLRSLRQKKVPNPESYLGKIYAYAKMGNLEKAFDTLAKLEAAYGDSIHEDDDLFSPFSSLNPLVLACSRNGFATLDFVYYQLENVSRDEGSHKSISSLNCVILGCANIWDVDRAYQTFNAIAATFGLTPNIHSYNALICAFGKLGKRDEAVKVFEHFVGLGTKPNVTTYTLLIDAHLIKRDPKAALTLMDEMVDEGYEPSKAMLKKVRRRCIREMDYESDDKVDWFAKKFNIRLGSETRRDALFNLQYSTEYA
ncbi:hypothetical protein M569_03636 [Genlisea aurea]|uniref:Pentacotripeptide-repeat region of PRORP domain-containing protein n=1 Tax=Genlisea aurea TaxID=192259 RepID=S8D1A9_9LAMI|nr:hypothetical protein M569_03636 [Genlisea aurea]